MSPHSARLPWASLLRIVISMGWSMARARGLAQIGLLILGYSVASMTIIGALARFLRSVTMPAYSFGHYVSGLMALLMVVPAVLLIINLSRSGSYVRRHSREIMYRVGCPREYIGTATALEYSVFAVIGVVVSGLVYALLPYMPYVGIGRPDAGRGDGSDVPVAMAVFLLMPAVSAAVAYRQTVHSTQVVLREAVVGVEGSTQADMVSPQRRRGWADRWSLTYISLVRLVAMGLGMVILVLLPREGLFASHTQWTTPWFIVGLIALGVGAGEVWTVLMRVAVKIAERSVSLSAMLSVRVLESQTSTALMSGPLLATAYVFVPVAWMTRAQGAGGEAFYYMGLLGIAINLALVTADSLGERSQIVAKSVAVGAPVWLIRKVFALELLIPLACMTVLGGVTSAIILPGGNIWPTYSGMLVDGSWFDQWGTWAFLSLFSVLAVVVGTLGLIRSKITPDLLRAP